jgi:ComF family protein
MDFASSNPPDPADSTRPQASPAGLPRPDRPRGVERLWQAVVAGLFPARCLGCGQRGTALCPTCRAELPRLRPPLCPRCSRPERSGLRCAACRRAYAGLATVRAPCAYAGAVGVAVRRLKYGQERHLVALLGGLLHECLADRPLAVDALVPVPLDAARLRARGYNQAALLATSLGAALGWPVLPNALQRTRPTRPQVGLSPRERRANVRGAFGCPAPALIQGRRLLLIDDVMTTGATLEACAEALVAAGAARVYGLVVARDVPAPPTAAFARSR